MMKRNYRQIASKGLKTRVMEQHPLLRSHLPRTVWFSIDSLKRMLREYPTVFVKPDKGGGGAGIVRIRERSGNYEVCFRQVCRTLEGATLPFTVEKLLSPGRKYLLQQGIDLATVQSRPFDIRVLLQKPNRWTVSGMVAKVAGKGQFLTNHSQGGRPLQLEQALKKVDLPKKPERLKRVLERVSLLAAEVLEARFPGIKELGIDVGLDQQGKLWIFEVNTRPRFQMFRKIGRPEIYRRILMVHRRL